MRIDDQERKRLIDEWACPDCGEDLMFASHTNCPTVIRIQDRVTNRQSQVTQTAKDMIGAGSKASNPKDIVGSDKLPMSLVPGSLKAYATLGFLEGMLKYGLVNWREVGVRASIYMDALERHYEKFKNGEWEDKTTGVPHLASMLACIGIIIDSYENGNLTDDRPKQAPTSELIDRLEANVKRLKALHADKNPKHYTHQPKDPK